MRGDYVMEFSRHDTTVIKGIAICLMLYHHLFGFSERLTEVTYVSLFYFNGTNLAECLGAFGKVCVPLFTLLSGYGCYMSSCRTNDTQAIVQRQITRLYKGFWTVFFICLPILIYEHRALRSQLLYEIIYNFLNISTSFNGEWWFILPFTVLLIFFPTIKRFLERKESSFCTDVFLLVVLTSLLTNLSAPLGEVFSFSTLSENMFWMLLELAPPFITGCIFAKYNILSRTKGKFGGRPLCCAAALIMLGVAFLERPYLTVFYDYIITSVLTVSIIILLPTKPMALLGKVFEKLGEESTYMWLIHSFFCYYWLPKLTYMPKYSPLIFLWLLLLSFVSAKIIRLIRKYFGVLCDKLAQRNGAAA